MAGDLSPTGQEAAAWLGWPGKASCRRDSWLLSSRPFRELGKAIQVAGTHTQRPGGENVLGVFQKGQEPGAWSEQVIGGRGCVSRALWDAFELRMDWL